jgi:hypothetical protein
MLCFYTKWRKTNTSYKWRIAVRYRNKQRQKHTCGPRAVVMTILPGLNSATR